MADKDTDLQKIKRLLKIMKENDLVEIEIKHGDDKICLRRSDPQPTVRGTIAAAPVIRHESPVANTGSRGQNAQASASESAQAGQEEDLTEIKSPIVGTFYSTASPDSGDYVELGSHVDSQAVVCIIEAMKVMNEIRAETTGTIAEILVTNGQAVEYGQVLFRVKPE